MTERKIWESDLLIEMVAHKPVEMSLDACIKCNICVTACPVAAVTDLFPGPKYEAPQSGRIFGQPFSGLLQRLPGLQYGLSDRGADCGDKCQGQSNDGGARPTIGAQTAAE
jgi:ferredoxin